MPFLQDVIHQLEVGGGKRYVRALLGVLAVAMLLVGYNWRCFRNFSTQEAMDSAQLARNLSTGQGYTTKFIRPFSMFLVKRANQARLDKLTPEQKADLCEVKGKHPDIANPPLYPLVLAGVMKVVPPTADAAKERPFWWSDGRFARYQPDFAIAVFNELLLLVAAVLVFFLARRLFDNYVAWLSGTLVLLTNMLWRFSVAGLSTMLLLLLFLGLVWALVRFEAAAREPATRLGSMVGLAVLLGLLLGLGTLTRYAFGFLLLPVLAFVFLYGGRWRVPAALLVTIFCVAVVTPWLVRNISVCGQPFGTAGYAVLENSSLFPGHRLERSLTPDFSQFTFNQLWWKFFTNLRQIILNELPKSGGGLALAFFLVGLMVNYRNPALSRLRYFTLLTLVVLLAVQALGRTALSDDSPEINSENLLVLLLPLIVIFGVSFFHVLLDQLPDVLAGMRLAVTLLFAGLAALPIIFSFLPPRTPPVSFPPYFPPTIQAVAGWMRPGELTMSDVPWAVAWYGDRQAILLTLNAEDQFYALNDYIKPVRALYLTPQSMDVKFQSQWGPGGSEGSWGSLIVNALSRQVLPQRFPLHKSVRLPDQLFLSDWERWQDGDAPAPAGQKK